MWEAYRSRIATPISHTEWRRIESIFAAAVGRPTREREAFLERACAGAPSLRRVVDELLSADASAVGFLEDPLRLPNRGPEDETPLEKPGASWEESAIGPYRLLRPLGQGGMGTVFLAQRRDGSDARKVAIKFSRFQFKGSEIVSRFYREREILARVEHPNIARLLDAGTTRDGRPFLVMQYIEGLPLDRFCDRNRLRLQERATLLAKLADAVHFVHRNHAVHRDLKPDNVLVDADGEPKLLDFGIAKLLDRAPTSQARERTRTGFRLMSYHYASPEQIRGEEITFASDIYSLGVVSYEVFCGQSPYREGANALPYELAREICEAVPQLMSRHFRGLARRVLRDRQARAAADRRSSPSDLHRQLRFVLDNVVAKTLAKNPERRYDSAQELAEDLRAFGTGRPVRARPETMLCRGFRRLRRIHAAVLSRR